VQVAVPGLLEPGSATFFAGSSTGFASPGVSFTITGSGATANGPPPTVLEGRVADRATIESERSDGARRERADAWTWAIGGAVFGAVAVGAVVTIRGRRTR
jgi:hypothetical protein